MFPLFFFILTILFKRNNCKKAESKKQLLAFRVQPLFPFTGTVMKF
ncbi:hypothetical protein CUZ89_0903 [Enterococcus xinjiangensis]|nr:hypothetical protein [Enterococcus lactis]MBL4990819.1 hypothetical protein [Enterococcus lactis]MBL4995151.1 hypothetical protein [Enterococcus lactis]MBL5001101.1 hypothetical protein [Enterococcus lactis]MBL5002722.1 hypothetical protein [Enterococcus lactis]